MTVKELAGEYAIIGSNQDAESNTYKGKLTLTIDKNKRVNAKWLINNTQEQLGTGFFKNNILVINFNYKSDGNVLKGVVVYKCITKDILDGFWSEKHGDPMFLGQECCYRLNSIKEVVN